MSYTIKPFHTDYIDDATALLATNYARAQCAEPNLPALELLGNGQGAATFRLNLEKDAHRPGFAAFQNGQLCAFMLETMRFSWKGQQVVASEEMSHAARVEDRAMLYRLLYRELAHRWVSEGRHLHIVNYLAHETSLTECLYLLGFGAILAQEIRDVSSSGPTDEFEIVENPSPAALLELQREHSGYYATSPIFLRRNDSDAEIVSELEEHLADGDRIFSCISNGQQIALFIVGESAADGEGLLLRRTNSAQLKSAYIRPTERRRGLGAALLERSISWTRQQGYDRLFVEHETANLSGSAFWGKYFKPFVYVTMRYVDNSL
ncbi:MAG: GNAT family N-acetyltransferase [Caldilineaceae bacterium]|nr:GNAT family N-acetyltransferase [Caldilineaceae bacterium]